MEEAKRWANPVESFRQALHRSIFRRPGGQTTSQVLADVLRVDESTISRWCDLPSELARSVGSNAGFDEPKHVSSKHLPAMAQMTRSGQMGAQWLEHLAMLAGGVFVPLPHVRVQAPVRLSETMRAMSAVIDAQAALDERGTTGIDHAEAARIRACWNELVQRGESMVRQAEAAADITPDTDRRRPQVIGAGR